LPGSDPRVRHKFAYLLDNIVYVNGDATRMDLWMFTPHVISQLRLGEGRARQIDIEILRYVKSIAYSLREAAKAQRIAIRTHLVNLADLIEFYALDYELDIHTARLQNTRQGEAFLDEHRLEKFRESPENIGAIARALDGVIHAGLNEEALIKVNELMNQRADLVTRALNSVKDIFGKGRATQALLKRLNYRITRQILKFVKEYIKDVAGKNKSSLVYKETLAEPLKIAERIGRAEDVIGIPFYTEKDTLENVFRRLMQGTDSERRSVMLPIGEAVSGELLEIVRNIKLKKNVHRIAFLKDALLKGKGWSMRMMMEIAQELGADICFVDADERRVTPDWTKSLLMPIQSEGFDYVCPRYTRHHHSATITNHILYPLVSSVYKTKVRQPIGGEFGVSNKLIKVYVKDSEVWFTEVGTYGVDNWMTTEAIVNGAKIAEVDLGVKAHSFSNFEKREVMFRQVMEIVFDYIIKNAGWWKKQKEIKSVPLIGPLKREEPELIKQDWRRWTGRFKDNFNLSRNIQVYEGV
ncbi:MAG: hypothetical protein KAR32_13965, partial [Candidatus Omnitrophica bacterium]|nr:hypothetical protein [Candidatus Omnitrophota bacterium]